MVVKKTTVETVSRKQIRLLQTESAEAGDLRMVETCDRAMGAFSAQPEDGCQAALAMCVWVIRDAEGMV